MYIFLNYMQIIPLILDENEYIYDEKKNEKIEYIYNFETI